MKQHYRTSVLLKPQTDWARGLSVALKLHEELVRRLESAFKPHADMLRRIESAFIRPHADMLRRLESALRPHNAFLESLAGVMSSSLACKYIDKELGSSLHASGVLPRVPRQDKRTLVRGGEGIFTPNQLRSLQQEQWFYQGSEDVTVNINLIGDITNQDLEMLAQLIADKIQEGVSRGGENYTVNIVPSEYITNKKRILH